MPNRLAIGISQAQVYRRAHWRRLWHRHGPLLPIAFGAGMIVGSWLALIVMEAGKW